jgi:hypothetical protein
MPLVSVQLVVKTISHLSRGRNSRKVTRVPGPERYSRLPACRSLPKIGRRHESRAKARTGRAHCGSRAMARTSCALMPAPPKWKLLGRFPHPNEPGWNTKRIPTSQGSSTGQFGEARNHPPEQAEAHHESAAEERCAGPKATLAAVFAKTESNGGKPWGCKPRLPRPAGVTATDLGSENREKTLDCAAAVRTMEAVGSTAGAIAGLGGITWAHWDSSRVIDGASSDSSRMWRSGNGHSVAASAYSPLRQFVYRRLHSSHSKLNKSERPRDKSGPGWIPTPRFTSVSL